MGTKKKTLYVGGLAEDVDNPLLKKTFSAFGEVVDVNLPVDYSTNKHKGYAFIEFRWPEDASDAIDNLDNGEILGKTIRVNIAKPMKFKENSNKPIWADEDHQKNDDTEVNSVEEIDENG